MNKKIPAAGAGRDGPKRSGATLSGRRWLSIALLAGAGATAVSAGLGWVNQAASWVFEQSATDTSWFGAAIAFGALVAGTLTLRRIRALPVQGRFAARLRYPSTWLAGLVGTALMFTANARIPPALTVPGSPQKRADTLLATDAAVGEGAGGSNRVHWLRRVDAWPSSIDEAVWCSLMTLLLGVPAGVVAADWGSPWHRWVTRRRPRYKPGKQDEPPKSELDFWLQAEGHDAYGEDRLERKGIADRIAARLRSGRAAIELYGALGSGKTTVLRIVSAQIDRLRDEYGRTIVVARLSVWPKDTQAAHMVLTKLLDTAAGYVDVARVGGLADAFREAMNATDHWLLKMLHALTRSGDDYQQQLAALDTALGAVGVHVVLMLEDLDRAENTTPLQVEAMLDALKTMHNVSYVVAIGRLGAPN